VTPVERSATVAGERTRTFAAVPPALVARALEALLSAALLGSLAYLALRPIDDPDLWWHLAAGRRMLDGLGIPWTDPYSYVAHGNPWVAYSWLAEVAFARLDRMGGPGLLILLAGGLFAATFAVVLRTCRASGARHLPAFLATAAAALAASPCRTVRPHLLSFLCMALFCHLVVRDRRRRDAGVWLLVPVFVLWANTHILFPFGLVVLAFHALAGGRAWWGRTPWQRVALVVCLAASSLLNPYGWHLLHHVWVMAHQPVALGLVAEFQTPSLHGPIGVMLTGFLFATVLVMILSPARKDWAEMACVFGFGFLALAMARNIPFFAIAAAPVLARHLDALWPRDEAVEVSPGRPQVLVAAVALHLAMLVTVGVAIGRRGAELVAPGAAVDHDAFPVDAVRFLNERPPLGRLFNDFNWGGYLIGHLKAPYQVSMDGRTQVYGEETLRQYRALIHLEAEWRQFFARCAPDVILWPKKEPFARLVELMPDWTKLYEDGVAVIFVRRPPPTGSPL
jgi:hypothetical protein